MLFKDISVFSSGCHFVQQSGRICAILIEGIIGNIYEKNNLDLDQWCSRCRFKKKLHTMDDEQQMPDQDRSQ